LNNALDYIQTEHSERVENVDAFFEKSWTDVSFRGSHRVYHLAELVDLRDA